MIEVKNLNQRINNHHILKNINFKINKGETFVIIGTSGSGKTTLLKLLIGLLKPTEGSIILDNVDISKISEEEFNKMRKHMGMVFQYSALFDSLSIFENIAFPLKEMGEKDEGTMRDKALTTLNLVGLDNILDEMPDELSGGMKKRVGLARAIITNPTMLFYDEPSSGLDPVTSDKIDDLIVDLQKKLNVTSIVVTHDLKSAFYIADKIGMLYKGELIFNGTVEELKNSSDPRIIEFINATKIRKR